MFAIRPVGTVLCGVIHGWASPAGAAAAAPAAPGVASAGAAAAAAVGLPDGGAAAGTVAMAAVNSGVADVRKGRQLQTAGCRG